MSQGDADVILNDLDQKSRDILLALSELEETIETIRTPDLIETTGIDRAQIHYRIAEYLETHGLVETHQPAGEPGSVPPKEIWLTERGRELLSEIGGRTHTGDVGDRLSRLEERMNTLQSTVQGLDDPSEEAATTTDIDVEQLQQQVANLALEIEDLKDDPLFNRELRAEIDDMRSGMLAVTQYLIEKHDEQERIEELNREYHSKIQPLADF